VHQDPIQRLHEALQKLIGLHRQLLDSVRLEREALTAASLKDIQDATFAKQALIEAIRQAETERLRATGELAIAWKRPVKDLTLGEIVIAVQGRDAKTAETLRSSLNALNLLIKRIREQNDDNRGLVERSLEHVHQMKRNVLGEAVPNTGTYTQQGQKNPATGGARLISKEA
jgi:flagellar biosynthesis/type III secretory pathway chaperone